jgi:hypothetical protein
LDTHISPKKPKWIKNAQFDPKTPNWIRKPPSLVRKSPTLVRIAQKEAVLNKNFLPASVLLAAFGASSTLRWALQASTLAQQATWYSSRIAWDEWHSSGRDFGSSKSSFKHLKGHSINLFIQKKNYTPRRHPRQDIQFIFNFFDIFWPDGFKIILKYRLLGSML